jgi:cysteine-rich repeat protein
MKTKAWPWLVVAAMAITVACGEDEPPDIVAPSCTDGVKNGDEEGSDCGGACPACVEAPDCKTDAQCPGGHCVDSVCVASGCGDGTIDAGESCDDGNDIGGDGCTACVTDTCGDGVVNDGGAEACDNGARNSDTEPDACRTDCTRPRCGDRVVDGDESCEDGNDVDGDGCTACVADTCGDGVVNDGGREACDDGPRNSDTEPGACRSDCTLPRCGDLVVDGDESCDDGNSVDGDGCTACKADTCGDGVVNDGGTEACDDGPLNSDTLPDACRTNCTLARCGDSVVDAGELCDDGNTDPGDECTELCVPATCGDGIVQIGVEACDDGANNSDTEPDACRTGCELPRCGDTVLDTGEACDHGSTDDTGLCLSTCVEATCGDGFVRAGVEECDDANGNPVDACQNDCRFSPPVHADQSYIPTTSIVGNLVSDPTYQTFIPGATGLLYRIDWWAGLSDGTTWDGAHYQFELREGAGPSGTLLATFDSIAPGGGRTSMYATSSIQLLAGATYSLVFSGTGVIRSSYSNGYPGCSTLVGFTCDSSPYDIFFETWLRYY